MRPIVTKGGNFFTDDSCGPDAGRGEVVNPNPLTQPLADYGGPTHTHALDPASPAIDMARDEGCQPTDQRGVPRPFGAACDAGAFEAEDVEPMSGEMPEGIPTGPTTCRFGPRPIYPPISYLSEGQTVQLLSRNEAATWVEVQSLDGNVGPCWVDVDLLDILPTVDLPSLDLGYIPPEPTLTPTPEPEEPSGGGQQGCLVYDQNQQDWVCQAPCPPEWQEQSPETCTK